MNLDKESRLLKVGLGIDYLSADLRERFCLTGGSASVSRAGISATVASTDAISGRGSGSGTEGVEIETGALG